LQPLSEAIAAIRKDYHKAALDEAVVGDDPISFFLKWFQEAQNAAADEVNAMTLATCDASGQPHARIVLLKGVEQNSFVFYTNYNSHKGAELTANNKAALVFFWKELERQVRVEGIVEKTNAATSDTYFQSRPEGSRLGAWSSPQSAIITDRNLLDANYAQYKAQFGNDIPRPSHWGGYQLVPTLIEFWQGRSNRMHDRICFEKANNSWKHFRLAP
jgi:pyridoxamine 5'-phosphate oxidase